MMAGTANFSVSCIPKLTGARALDKERQLRQFLAEVERRALRIAEIGVRDRDEALDLVHDGISRVIAEHGPQSVLPFNYAGPHGELAGGSMDWRFYHQIGASLVSQGPFCG